MNVNGKTQSMIAVRLAETLKYGKNSSLANILKER